MDAKRLAEMAQGFRDLADWLEQNPNLPFYFAVERLLIPVGCEDDPAAALAAFARSGGTWEKQGSDEWFGVRRTFGPNIAVEAYAERAKVCERKVVGTETVEVPDPDAPKVTIEREVVAWECKPLLAGAAS